MWSDYISRQFLAVPETAGPLIILNSKYVYFSLRRLTSSFINIYLYFFLRGFSCIFNCCLGVDSFCKSIFSFVSCSSFRPAYSNAGWILLLFSHSAVSDSLWPHRLQHARLPWPSPSPGVCSNSCLLTWWCDPTISSFVALFSCPQSFPATGSFSESALL